MIYLGDELMVVHPRSRMTLAVALILAGAFLAPPPADARSSRRRNYAAEMRQERLEDERREERERARQERREEREQAREQFYEHSDRARGDYIRHNERQLDRVIQHREGTPSRHYVPSVTGGGGARGSSRSGGSCMYGPNNEVLYAPAGAVCGRAAPSAAPAAPAPR